MGEKSIMEQIKDAMDDVESNNFEPVFIVVNELIYRKLVSDILSYYDGQNVCHSVPIPDQVFGIPIVLIEDLPFDMRVLSYARHEFSFDVRKK